MTTGNTPNMVSLTGGGGTPQRATAAQRKLAASLQHARHRHESGLFAIEGTRAVTDTLGLFRTEMLLTTPAWLESAAAATLTQSVTSGDNSQMQVLTVSESEMQRISSMKTPQGVMAVCRIPAPGDPLRPDANRLVLALDDVQDPGNLGTIIRVADWFGVNLILASHNTVDAFNPKVVQATMGALARVEVRYVDLPATLAELADGGMPVYGTMLDGDDIHTAPLGHGGVVVMGNEGNGLSAQVRTLLTHRLLIPPYPRGACAVESLNVAMATGIVLNEFRRRL